MKRFHIKADVDDDVFEYWYQEMKNNVNIISQLINYLDGSEKLVVGDVVSIQFDTKRIGFERNLVEDYCANKFKIDHKYFEYLFLTSNDKIDLVEEYILIPITTEW